MLKTVLSRAVVGAVALSSVGAYATLPGLYGIAGLGYKLENKVSGLPERPAEGTPAGGTINLGLGNQITRTFSIEGEYSGSVNRTTTARTNSSSLRSSSSAHQQTRSTTISVVSVSAKGSFPLTPESSLFGTVGGAYVDQRNLSISTGSGANADVGTGIGSLAPVVGVGVSYDANPNVSVIGNYKYAHPINGRDTDRPASVAAFTVGVNYYFG